MGDAYSHASASYDHGELKTLFIRELAAYLRSVSEGQEDLDLLKKLTLTAFGRAGAGSAKWDFDSHAWLYRDFSETALRLKSGDFKTWANLLGTLRDDILFRELKELSPWAGKPIIIVHYDHRDGRGDFHYALASRLKARGQKPEKIILVVLPADIFTAADIFTINPDV